MTTDRLHERTEPMSSIAERRFDALEREVRVLRQEARRARRVALLAVATLAFAVPGVAFSQAFAWPSGWRVFSSGAPAVAADVNANFQWLLQKIGTHPSNLEVAGGATVAGAMMANSVSATNGLVVGADASVNDNLTVRGTALLGLVRVSCPASGRAPINATCACPAGTRVLSGGFAFSSMEHPNTVLASYPESDTVWHVTVGRGTDHTDGTAFVMCARIST